MAQLTKQQLVYPSGFVAWGPRRAIAQLRVLDIIRAEYERAGYVPIETSMVERPEVLAAKAEGEIKNQIYGLRLMNPGSDAPTDEKNLAIRFDQTVPLARFVAAHHGELLFPFRRYVIGPVIRGERPKKGRFRQFIQADIDVIGDGKLSLIHDSEPVAVICRIFSALNIGSFTVRIGHRKILEGICASFGISNERIKPATKKIDEIDKVGRNAVITMLGDFGLSTDQARSLIDFLTKDLPTDELIAYLKAQEVNALYAEGVTELERVIADVRRWGVPDSCFRADISVARGLDYYTGIVYETRLDAHPEIGSIASGGRYDDLASVYIDKSFPGVGISIGVTRLVEKLIEAELLPATAATIAHVMVTTQAGTEKYADAYLSLTQELRDANIPCEIYLEERKLGGQLQYADRRGFTLAIIAGENELASNTVNIRNLKTGDQCTVSRNELVETVRTML